MNIFVGIPGTWQERAHQAQEDDKRPTAENKKKAKTCVNYTGQHFHLILSQDLFSLNKWGGI